MKKIIVIIIIVLLAISILFIAYQKRNYIISEYNTDPRFCLTVYDCTWQSTCSLCFSCNTVNIFNVAKLDCPSKSLKEKMMEPCPMIYCSGYKCKDNKCVSY